MNLKRSIRRKSSKAKVDEDEFGWDGVMDKYYDRGFHVEEIIQDLVMFHDEKTRDLVKAHYLAVCRCRGYDIPVAAPEGLENILVIAVPIDDPA